MQSCGTLRVTLVNIRHEYTREASKPRLRNNNNRTPLFGQALNLRHQLVSVVHGNAPRIPPRLAPGGPSGFQTDLFRDQHVWNSREFARAAIKCGNVFFAFRFHRTPVYVGVFFALMDLWTVNWRFLFRYLKLFVFKNRLYIEGIKNVIDHVKFGKEPYFQHRSL